MSLNTAAPNSALHKQKRHKYYGDRPVMVEKVVILDSMFQNVRAIWATILPLEEGVIKEFYLQKICVQRYQIEQIEQHTKSQSTNTIWKKERSVRITASRAHQLLTKHTVNWNTKIKTFLQPSEYKSSAMIYGTNNEENARKCYAANQNCTDSKVGFVISYDHPWLGCSPDGYIVQDKKIY